MFHLHLIYISSISIPILNEALFPHVAKPPSVATSPDTSAATFPDMSAAMSACVAASLATAPATSPAMAVLVANPEKCHPTSLELLSLITRDAL